MINRCIRCGDDLQDFTGINGIVHPVAGRGIKHCKSCELIFHDLGQEVNRVKVYIEWPKDRCRECYNQYDISLHFNCTKCGASSALMNEFPCRLMITPGLVKMILDSRRCWDESWYGCHPIPDKKVGDHCVGYIMAIMFGYNKNFKSFGLGHEINNMINLESVKYGEVWATPGRNDVI